MLSYPDVLEIGLAADQASFERLLVRAAGELGFGLAAGVMVRGRFGSRGAVVRPFGNTPAAFVEASRTVDIAARDPVLTDLLGRPGVVTYDQGLYASRGASDLWDWQAPYGYREGMAVAMHQAARSEVFTFGVDGSAVPHDTERRLRLEAELRLICMHAQSAAQRLYFPSTVQVEAAALDRNELEALKWAKDGVSVWVTGDKLRISNKGVEQLLDSAQRKLGAATRSAAVLRAIEGGKIDR